MIQQIISLLNPWVIFGFAAQFVFFLRFAVQWYVSEKKKESVIPVAFWYLSLVGTIMILAYSIQRKDIVFTTASVLNAFIYIRNLALIGAKKKKENQATETQPAQPAA
ncbi:MAG: hypothetical protein ACD_22C00210G0001 [uncultured bacterium]|uniref:Lipid A biosynthesis protein n=1 Tax=candidate division WWE3 bacterium TaxID=2053526 RepID=A0A656PPV8_UNCKA|nr:Lipid A biosynthesis protein [candidate division WWE3 bacterium RAAC2_WWE3_1]EKD99668.1 MAG: hypothetical protein ACD_22C00210G0001 [uncultured bacterium]KKS29732.1 MAG: Lipid A biosynthesis protein [candidate division WWE3 bacterium GW2011_GWB1_42_117]KKS55542.1 MAG: Lipid A biosynthesis protein [candidate division WWE3 bacterium GW2011_GWD2_42_34]KKT06027.1 MAG: Lipid A biosynthesis protein [candidate division WWE3 bacterium GW2011_GWE2_43_18]KKT06945.1 MAG: Lipid A biosynthesis protein [